MSYCFYIKDISKMWNISDINSLSLQIHQQIQNTITEILLWKKCQNSCLRGIKILPNKASNMYEYNV